LESRISGCRRTVLQVYLKLGGKRGQWMEIKTALQDQAHTLAIQCVNSRSIASLRRLIIAWRWSARVPLYIGSGIWGSFHFECCWLCGAMAFKSNILSNLFSIYAQWWWEIESLRFGKSSQLLCERQPKMDFGSCWDCWCWEAAKPKEDLGIE